MILISQSNFFYREVHSQIYDSRQVKKAVLFTEFMRKDQLIEKREHWLRVNHYSSDDDSSFAFSNHGKSAQYYYRSILVSNQL